MADVFVSYSRTDEATADAVAGALRGEGFAVWRDDQLPALIERRNRVQEVLAAARRLQALLEPLA